MQTPRIALALALLLLSLVLLPGCTGSEEPATLAKPVKITHQGAPDFTVTNLRGETLKLSEMAGSVVVLDFWATWCPPCRDSIPHLDQLYKEYEDKGVRVIGLSLDTDMDELQQYATNKRMSYDVAMIGMDVKTDYNVSSIPRMFIVDKTGKIRGDYLGFSFGIAREMKEKIDQLLAE